MADRRGTNGTRIDRPDGAPARSWQESSRECREALHERTAAMWERFCVLWDPKVDGDPSGWVDLADDARRRSVMRANIDHNRPAAWYFVNWLEANDLDLAHKFRPGPALEPCPHLPGSEGRIRTIETRLATGQELFHPLDRTGVEDLDEMFGAAAGAALTRSCGGDRDPIKVPRFRRKKRDR